MEAPGSHERVVHVVLVHVLDNQATFARRFADAFAADAVDERDAALPAPLRTALRDCDARAEVAATVARLAAVSRAARQLAEATLAAPARAACVAKAEALHDVAAAALDAGLLDHNTFRSSGTVLAKILRMCAGKRAALWRARWRPVARPACVTAGPLRLTSAVELRPPSQHATAVRLRMRSGSARASRR